MLTTSRPSWFVSETEVTPEDVYINRREWLRAAGLRVVLTSAASCLGGFASTVVAAIGGYPAKRNNTYVLDRDLTLKKRQQHIQIFMNLGRRKIFGVMHKS